MTWNDAFIAAQWFFFIYFVAINLAYLAQVIDTTLVVVSGELL